MDKLHSMELFLLEELENCEGTFEDLDLLSLETDNTQKTNTPASSPSKSKDIEREWEISLYDVQFHKRSELYMLCLFCSHDMDSILTNT